MEKLANKLLNLVTKVNITSDVMQISSTLHPHRALHLHSILPQTHNISLTMWKTSDKLRLGDIIKQGSPTPRPQTGTCPWPIRNWAAQQEVIGR